MKKKYTLLEALEEEKHNKKTFLPKGITYQEYTLMVEKKEIEVFIPYRESNQFEKDISSYDNLTKENLRYVLRKYRGIKG